MQNILLDLQSELHKTIIFITHDLDEALKIGDRIAILRDGSIVQDSDPQEIIMTLQMNMSLILLKTSIEQGYSSKINQQTNTKSSGATVRRNGIRGYTR